MYYQLASGGTEERVFWMHVLSDRSCWVSQGALLHHFLLLATMTKRPGQPCGDTDRVRVKCRVELRDDGGERETKVEMDTPLTGQVPSYVDSDSDPDLAVPGQPDSKMVEDKWKPEDHAFLDAYLNNCYPFQPYSRPVLELILVDMVNKFAEQNGHKVEAKKIIEDYEWFRGFLIMQWQSKSFMKVRRLGECPLHTFPMNRIARFIFPSRNSTAPINHTFIIRRRHCGGRSR